MGTAGWGATNWESVTDTRTTTCDTASAKLLHAAQGAQRGALWGSRWMGWGGVLWRKAQDGGDTCAHVADSLRGTAETHATW